MVIGLFGIDAVCLSLVRSGNVVCAEVEGSDHVEGDLAVKPEALETDRGDFFAALVEGTNLCARRVYWVNRLGREIGEVGLTDCADEEAMVC